MATPKSPQRATRQKRAVLLGSERPPLANSSPAAPPPLSKKITVTLIVSSKQSLKAANRLGRHRLTRAQFRQLHGADPTSIKLVRAFAKEYGLTIAPNSPSSEHCTLKLTGTIAAFQRAFGIAFSHRNCNGITYRVREGHITLPAQLLGHVKAVLGLDNRPQAEPHFRIAGQKGNISAREAQGAGFATPHVLTANATNVSYTPVQVAHLYQFPADARASGQTIGIIELGGGYRSIDLANYFKSLNQMPPKVTAVSVDGGKNSPSNANSADGEVMLDIEVSAAVAPGANIAVYFAPNTDQGFIDAVTTAIHDRTNNPSVISISWGSAEVNWTQQAMTALDSACQAAATLGITITVAAGDNGSSDGATGNNVDFPASSPHVLGCGGTKLNANGSTITSETVWNESVANEGATGGGVSNVFPLPTWQTSANVPKSPTAGGGRGIPDVAGNADPATGYNVLVDGQTLVIGGTSAVAPLWAGLIAVANAQNGKLAGFLQPQIYTTRSKPAFRDITSGNNGSFSADIGWDACTGLGSPIAARLIALIKPFGSSKTGKQPGRPAKPTTESTKSRPPRKLR